VKAHQVGRFLGRPCDLAGSSQLGRGTANRLGVGRALKALIPQEGRRTLAVNILIEVRQLVVTDLIRAFLPVVTAGRTTQPPQNLAVFEDFGFLGVVRAPKP
jgi:hypothetical protein